MRRGFVSVELTPSPLAHVRVDWFKLLRDLRYADLPMREVARRLTERFHFPVDEANLRYYKGGGEPTHHVGEGLVVLWCEVTGKGRDALPMQPVVPRRGSKPAR